MKTKIFFFFTVAILILTNCDDNKSRNYEHININTISVDSTVMANIVGKWQLIVSEDTTNNSVTVDTNKTLIFYADGSFGIATKNDMELKENNYYKVDYNSIYYINKQQNKVDSVHSFSYNFDKNRLEIWYEISNESSWGCSHPLLQYEILNYQKLEKEI
jgi:hypothetical protein